MCLLILRDREYVPDKTDFSYKLFLSIIRDSLNAKWCFLYEKYGYKVIKLVDFEYELRHVCRKYFKI